MLQHGDGKRVLRDNDLNIASRIRTSSGPQKSFNPIAPACANWLPSKTVPAISIDST